MRKLKVICNKWIPFPGFVAIMLFGVIFKRQEYCRYSTNRSIMNHEGIHVCQALDFVGHNEKLKILGFIIFYLLYFMEWLIKLIISIFTLGKVKAYHSISFEQEAYTNQYNINYQITRKRFGWIRCLPKLILKENKQY